MSKAIMPFKIGKVAIVGRPNVGKSTLLNALVHHKVAIVTDKAQTTRSQIMAFYEDERGQIFYLDTPGYFESKAQAQHYNTIIANSIAEADVVVYLVDQTRKWGTEEAKIWHLIEDSEKPFILVINKIDVPVKSHKDTYVMMLEDQAKAIIETSALKQKGVPAVTNALFDLLPSGSRDPLVDNFVTPLLSQSSRQFMEELIREKIYHSTGQEVPYQTDVRVLAIKENQTGTTLKIKGQVIVHHINHKAMLIGKKGQKIKEISQGLRKELEVATNKKIFIYLTVVLEK